MKLERHFGWMKFALGLCVLLLSLPAEAALLLNIPQEVKQADGTVLELLASGDEFYNYLHDAEGYTVMADPRTGDYVYADKNDGRLFPSKYKVGEVNPALVNLQAHLLDDVEYYRQRKEAFLPPTSRRKSRAPHDGEMANLAVFIRFSGESEFSEAFSTYDDMFNLTGATANSMYKYFKEVSYGSLEISTHFYPTPSGGAVVSYKDSHSRSYFQPYHASNNPNGYPDREARSQREWDLLKDALNAVKDSIPGTLDLDQDEDGLVDAVTFIVSGSVDGWSELLWPHRYYLVGHNVFINDKLVYDYTFQINQAMIDPSWNLGVGVLAHEMFHCLGAPDLYHYNLEDGWKPTGPWDVMELTADPPQHMGAYMKFRYGEWIDEIPEITTSGSYSLNKLQSASGNCYKIKSGASLTEFYVLEYRKASGTFEGSLPDSGLLIYRVDTSADGQGNSGFPPDELYLFRPGGSHYAVGDVDSAAFSSQNNRTLFNDETNPYPFSSDGVSDALIEVYDVGSSGGDSISFKVTIPDSKQCQACSGNSCGEGYICTSYEDTDIPDFCLQNCDSQGCLPGHTCTDLGGRASYCVPNLAAYVCGDNDLYEREQCGNLLLKEECGANKTCDETAGACLDHPANERDCEDEIDEDEDGRTDCEDTDCRLTVACGWDGGQCSNCDPQEIDTCKPGYNCSLWSNQRDQEDYWCAKPCQAQSDCPGDSACGSGSQPPFCLPVGVGGACYDNDLWTVDSCGNETPWRECDDETQYCDAEGLSCKAICFPKSCEDLEKTCGEWSDGCDTTLDCGACTEPDTCVRGACKCVPETCDGLSVDCGEVADDGCGGSLDCGGCSPGFYCADGICEWGSGPVDGDDDPDGDASPTDGDEPGDGDDPADGDDPVDGDDPADGEDDYQRGSGESGGGGLCQSAGSAASAWGLVLVGLMMLARRRRAS